MRLPIQASFLLSSKGFSEMRQLQPCCDDYEVRFDEQLGCLKQVLEVSSILAARTFHFLAHLEMLLLRRNGDTEKMAEENGGSALRRVPLSGLNEPQLENCCFVLLWGGLYPTDTLLI